LRLAVGAAPAGGHELVVVVLDDPGAVGLLLHGVAVVDLRPGGLQDRADPGRDRLAGQHPPAATRAGPLVRGPGPAARAAARTRPGRHGDAEPGVRGHLLDATDHRVGHRRRVPRTGCEPGATAAYLLERLLARLVGGLLVE